jgi:general secretion pathway protein E/type IV pilus assembly protein PilB
MPVAGGEMLTLRLLDLQEDLLWLGELGFTPDKETQFRKLLNRPAGLIIVCGPMNSGKSTTLYAALRELNTAARKWITLDVYATI